MKARTLVLPGLGLLALLALLALAGATLRTQPSDGPAPKPSRGPATSESTAPESTTIEASASAWTPPGPSDPEARGLMERLEGSFRQTARVVRMQIDTKRANPNIGQPDSVEIWGVLDGGTDNTSMLFVFSGPQLLRGTGLFLDDRWNGQEDAMWYHMRSFNRFKRLPQSSLRRLVAGTCLTYEDARGFFSTDKYEFHFAETPEPGSALRLTATPKTPELAADLGYRHMVLTLDPEKLLVLAAEYVDASGQRVKSFQASASTSIGNLWLPAEAAMEDLESQRSSQLRYQYWPLAEAPPESLFVTQLEGQSLLERFFEYLQSSEIPGAAEALQTAPDAS